MNIETTLRHLGLTEKQSKVYLALLELGEAPMTAIAKKAEMKRPTTYLAIDELNLLGLCSEILKGKKKFYSAVHPRRLIELMEFRRKQAERILPELLVRQETSGKPKVRMLAGMEGIRTAYQEAYALLNNKEEGLWLGNISFLTEKFPEVLKLYNQLLKKLSNPKIREAISGGEQSKKWVDDMQPLLGKNHYIKYIGDKNNFGYTDQFVIADTVMMFTLNTDFFVLIIESKEIAKSQRALFEMVWNNNK